LTLDGNKTVSEQDTMVMKEDIEEDEIETLKINNTKKPWLNKKYSKFEGTICAKN
jgi:hypothetical protein